MVAVLGASELSAIACELSVAIDILVKAKSICLIKAYKTITSSQWAIGVFGKTVLPVALLPKIPRRFHHR
jgi:hypothetical protein